MKLRNPKEFFNFLRKDKILGSDLSQKEVDGLNAVIDAGTSRGWKLSWLAYALATAYHETAHTMQPVKEFGGTAYYTRMYDVLGYRPKTAVKYGNTCAGDGPKYCGRGYVQLTWKNNYKKAKAKLGVDFVENPDLAMIPKHAADIMSVGMEEGWFTGVRLSTYLPNNIGTFAQFKSARKIINGTDKDSLIASYAETFQTALIRGEYK